MRLVALAEQRLFDTSNLSMVPEASIKLSLQPQTLKHEGSTPLVLTLTGEPSLPDPTWTSVVTTADLTGEGVKVEPTRIDSKTLTVTLPATLAPGGYGLKVEMPDEDDSDTLTSCSDAPVHLRGGEPRPVGPAAPVPCGWRRAAGARYAITPTTTSMSM